MTPITEQTLAAVDAAIAAEHNGEVVSVKREIVKKEDLLTRPTLESISEELRVKL